MTPDQPQGFRRVAPGVSFPDLEHRILDMWDEIGAFPHSVEMRPAESEYTFYDGPPFATGSPHYGHIVAGVIKDIVPRYWTMRGHRVVRRFGWDTHGLPVEMEVEKQLGVSGPRQIAEHGVDKFNEACRAMVESTAEDWEIITRRIGRWVDFRDDYRTMDPEFMESVWWVFKQLWDKGLVYQDFKVLPYSFGATTPLSNFEANMDYRDVDDPAITIRLAVVDGRGPVRNGDYLLVWTTTPWTLPGNLAVAVGEDLTYLRVRGAVDGHEGVYWVAEGLVEPFLGESAEVLATAAGADLLGTGYEPAFEYFAEERDRGAFRVIPSPEVTTDEGTGLVHMAPAYGEADFLALQAAGLDVLVDPIDAEARFMEPVTEVVGLNVKDADATLVRLLTERGALVRSERITHSYPFCWRTETPLIYKAIPTWFVRVESIRDRMVELNKSIHWVPEYVGTRRFGNWLEGARDWAISRNRYWGSCIPVWECGNCGEQDCMGSIDELEAASGVRVSDLHKHFVDPVTFECTHCDGTMRRIPEVLDCWFESGSMPYAQIHYPFEEAEAFDRRFPANFIAEGLDQTRAWFYTLLVLATALFDTQPFQNVVVNGMVLADDGRKMSKSLQNYPDPTHVIDRHGADALRTYLINSPLLRAEPLRFNESGVREVVRRVMLPLWNALSFFTTYAEADAIDSAALRAAPPPAERPEMDRWILSMLQSLVRRVNDKMEGYYLYAVIPQMFGFIDDLTNWYIRRSRRRFWRQRTGDDADKLAAFATLYDVLVTFAKVMAPVMPFITEEMYQTLVVRQRDAGAAGPASVHHCDYPEVQADLVDEPLERSMATVRAAVNLGRGLRVAHNVRIRQPLSRLTVITRDGAAAAAVASHEALLKDELNVKSVEVHSNEGSLMHLAAKPNYRLLGPRFESRMREMAAAIEELDEASVAGLLDTGVAQVLGETIAVDEVEVLREARAGTVVAAEGLLSVALDTELSESLVAEGLAREVIKNVQALRRSADLDVTDRIVLGWHALDDELAAAIVEHADLIAEEVLAAKLSEIGPGDGELVAIDGEPRLTVTVARA